MSIDIPANEQGVIRLFKVNLPTAEIAAFRDQTPDGWPMKDALGAAHLDPSNIELFDVKDLADMGLSQYLIDGQGVSPAEIDPMRPQLDGITGHVLLVFSSALGEATRSLTPKAPLQHIGTFFEDRPQVHFDTLPDESAQRNAPEEAQKTRKRPSDAAIGGRVAMVALLVAFGVAAMMVWLA